MRKHLTLIVVVVTALAVAAILFSSREIAARKVLPQGGSSSSAAPGYHLVTIAEMGISLELPDGWIDGETNDPMQVRVFTDAAKSLNLMIFSTSAAGKDFTAALAEADEQSQTAYEGQASIKVEREDPLIVAGMPGALRHRELLAAGMHDLAAVFELSDTLFTVTLRHEDGTDPTAGDEQLLRAVAASMKAIRE